MGKMRVDPANCLLLDPTDEADNTFVEDPHQKLYLFRQ